MRGNLLLVLGLAGLSAAASVHHRSSHPGHGDQGPPVHIKVPGGKPPKTVKPGKPNKPAKDSCLAGETPTVKAPKLNVWAQITPEDNRAVWNLLHDPKTGLNLTAVETAKHNDNYVFWIDSVPTNKTAVLPYLDGDAPAPAKYARAVIFEGGLKEPRSQEYMVGPLPVGPETTVQPLDYMYNGGTGGAIPYNGRYFDGKRSSASEPLIAQTMAGIADITQALFGGAYFGSGDSRTNLSSTSGTPLSLDGTQSFRNIMFRFPSQSTYLTPIDFYLIVDVSGTDPSLYKVVGFVTNERFFTSAEELRAAFDAGELKQEFQQMRDAPWAVLDYKPELGTRDLEDRFAPSSVEIGGKRYKLDKEAQYVEYMGWSFYIAFTRTVGLQYFDIKFKGERILYELSLQEAMAQYAGNQPKAANTVYHDTYYSLGTDMGTLIEGFDCPFGASMLNLTYHEGNQTIVNQDAVCIFEHDLNFPLSRHRTGGSNEWGFNDLAVVKGAALTSRAIATVGNYDYMFDYSFGLDGSIEIAVRASGYLQSSPYYAAQKHFGPRIQRGTMGSLHDHILTYKADFDIVDSANSFEVSKLVNVKQSQPWFPQLGEFEQMQMETSFIETEDRFNWGDNSGTMLCVVNKDKKNTWGENRGYRIIPGRSAIHLTPQTSPWSQKNSEFAKQNIAVSRVHDTEPLANSFQNVNLPQAPQQDFSKFFDGESLDQEDLVVWFNLGMHHFTRAEDIPVTLYTEAYSSIVFAPQNFFDRAQDGDLLNRRWVVPAENGQLEYEDLDVALPKCSINPTEPVLGISPVLEI